MQSYLSHTLGTMAVLRFAQQMPGGWRVPSDRSFHQHGWRGGFGGWTARGTARDGRESNLDDSLPGRVRSGRLQAN